MPPKNRQVKLICPKCNRRGFLRKKHTAFHLPQKNEVFKFYDSLDYLSKLHFRFFIDKFFLDQIPAYDNWPLKKYNQAFTFYKFPKSKIKEFETKAVECIIRKCRKIGCNIIYSKDLLKSIHLQHLINAKFQSSINYIIEPIYLSRSKLTILFRTILLMALKKCCELHQIGIEESFENEFVTKLKNVFYLLTLNVDSRNEWRFPYSITVNKEKEKKGKVRFEYYYPYSSTYRNRCKKCRRTYSLNHKLSLCDQCKFKTHLVKEVPSKSFLRNRFKKMESFSSNYANYNIFFARYMKHLREEWFSEKEIIRDLQRFFDAHSEEILKNLEMAGKTYYRILHYEEGKSFKKECNISKESEFLNIEIKSQEYIGLMRDYVKTNLYTIGKIKKSTYSKLVTMLGTLNFPERYILSKLEEDFKRYRWILHVEQLVKIISKYEKMLEKIITDIQKKNYVNIWMIRRDIDLSLYKLINVIINEKLLPSDQITSYKLMEKQFGIGENIPKDILFNVLPVLLRINYFNEKIMKNLF